MLCGSSSWVANTTQWDLVLPSLTETNPDDGDDDLDDFDDNEDMHCTLRRLIMNEFITEIVATTIITVIVIFIIITLDDLKKYEESQQRFNIAREISQTWLEYTQDHHDDVIR